MQKNRNSFQFPDRLPNPAKSRIDNAQLLWRILQCQPEVRDGEIKILKNAFNQSFKDVEKDFCELSESLFGSIRNLLKQSCRHRLKDFSAFVMRVASIYRKEQINAKSPGRILSMDIMIQIIQLLSMNPDCHTARGVIHEMGKHEPYSTLNDLDRSLVDRNFTAYLFITKQILLHPTLRIALENRDTIIYKASQKYPEVQIYFLENMFRSFVGQVLLSKKFKCDTLMVEWMQEYGFEPGHMIRISEYISFDCNFLQFRSKYRKAIQSLVHYTPSGENPEDSDVFLLRSLSNFYTSWLAKTAMQIPA